MTVLAVLAWWKEILGVIISTVVYIWITNLKGKNNYLQARENERINLDAMVKVHKELEDIRDKRKEEIKNSDDLNTIHKGA